MFTPLYSQKKCQTQKDEILSENQSVNMTKCPRLSVRPWGRRVTGSFVACSVSDKCRHSTRYNTHGPRKFEGRRVIMGWKRVKAELFPRLDRKGIGAVGRRRVGQGEGIGCDGGKLRPPGARIVGRGGQFEFELGALLAPERSRKFRFRRGHDGIVGQQGRDEHRGWRCGSPGHSVSSRGSV